MGRLGAVLKAIDLKTNKAVALKCIHPALIPDEDIGSRFLACMRVHKDSAGSGLTQVLDVGRDKRNYYIAREMLCGVTFKQLFEDQLICGQPFPLNESVEILQQIARVLMSVPGTAHGTFSPSKIWILDQRIHITDFGLAASLPPDAVWHCMRRRGNRYLAPEYIDNRPPDAAGDVYALGVMLGEMLSLCEFNGDIEIFRDSEPDFPVEIEALLRCALSQDVDVRYNDAIELASALYDVTGFQRTETLPPDNTNVVPPRILSTLRSMSDLPSPSQEAPDTSDTEQDLPPIPMPSATPDSSEPPDEMEIITRQVQMDALSDDSEEDELDFLDEIQPEFLDDDDEVDEEDLLLDSQPPAPSIPPPFRSDRRSAPPHRAPSVPPLPRPSQTVPSPQNELVSAPPPIKQRNTAPPIPKPSIPPVTADAATPGMKGGAGAAQKDGRPKLPAPPLSSAPPIPSLVKAMPKEKPEPPYEKFEGIDPRFLRAAAKLEKARISQVEKTGDGDEENDDWRRQLEASTEGSVVSFLPPSTIDNPKDVQGFPKNQQKMKKSQLPMSPKSKSIPPPLPPKRK